MAAAAQPVMEREVVKCAACLLTQFMTRSGNCRRCHVSLLPEPEPEPAPATPAEVVVMPAVRSRKPYVRKYQEPTLHIAGTVKMLRMALGLSQRALAKRMFVPRTYISKLENGKASPLITHLLRLCSALGVTPYQLVMLATL
jgi:DNA-binding XRE family transcriptional regulator